MHYEKKIILFLSLPLACLIILAGCTGLFTNEFYINETADWKLQSVTQDAIDLFLVTPVLILTTIFALKHKTAFLLWGGVNLYLVYTYIIYCFDVHFNNLFVVYCLSLGLSFYSFLYFLFSVRKEIVSDEMFRFITLKITAVYFVIIALLFYFLWLAEIIPAALHHSIPQSLKEPALPTNPIHVLDLSVILPAIFITGIFILKRKTTGLLLAPAILVFFILMDITIAAITIKMNMQGIEQGYAVAIITSMLVLFSFILLIAYLKNA